MGSSGSGSFSDYSGAPKPAGGAGGGGASGVDPCRQAFSCVLQEVAQCDFYSQTASVPSRGAVLGLMFDGRIFAIDERGTKVGALPTRFNYLAACLVDGIGYVGVVTSSATAPVPVVSADFNAT